MGSCETATSFLPQVPAGEADENILKARLARRKVQKLRTTVLDRLQQRRNRQMRFAHVEAEEAVIMAHGFDSGQCAPDIQRCAIRIAANRELDHMMPAQTLDEIRRRALRNDLAMIDNDQAVAETLGLVHVVSREQHGRAGALTTADNIPELSAPLRGEPGRRPVTA